MTTTPDKSEMKACSECETPSACSFHGECLSRPPADQVSDMVERVARAMFDNHNATYTAGGPLKWESDPDHWRRYATAAIAALKAVPAASEVGEMRDLLVAAYRTGAKDVHDFLAKLPDDERQMVLRDDRPDLTEAAHSYVDAALSQTQPQAQDSAQ